MKDFFIYILRCADNSYYTGHTDNLETRISADNTGISQCYTQNRRPLELVFVQPCASRAEAISAEQQIKKWSRKKKEALIKNNWDLLNILAKRKSAQTKTINRTYGSRLATRDTSPRTD